MASSDGVQSYVDSPGAAPSGEKPPEMSLETNEDSSYDSDFETDETGVSTSVGAHQNISRSSSAGCSTHHDVSRTVSDTLAAEFAEYVSADHKSYPDPTKAPGYAARVEFAVKLGYTEKLVLAALQKLGPEPIQNELLGELIKLSAKNQKTPDSPSSFVDTVASVSVAAPAEQLRPIVIDGSNVAMSHGNKEYFSCRGIKICVDWFRARGHKEITVFVPKWRKEASRPDNPIADQEILNELEKERFLVFTPSRQLGGKRMTCYDDRYILKLAAEVDGIVVSNDNYRDLMPENPEFKKIVEERILMFSFVNDLFMPPDDPLGRSGPTLGNFLRVTQKRGEPPPPCPYGKKCTYGNKCKFHHPERGNMPHKSVTEKLSEHAQKHSQGRENTEASSLKTFSLPLNYEHQAVGPRKTPLGRARSAAPAPPPMDPHSVITHFNRAQQEYQQSTKTPPKSRSIENITSGVMEMNIAGPSHLPTQRCAQNTPYTHTPPMWGSMMLNEPNWMYQEEPQESANRHRKLHRQLTLNPNYDPRLYRMPGYVGPPNVNGPGPSWGAMQAQQAQQAHQAQHETVARIASAPASSSYLHCPVEPQLPPPPQLQQTWPWAEHPDRSRVHFHLSSLFPEEQVQKAMALFPDDTHPKEICAAILNMFHKS